MIVLKTSAGGQVDVDLTLTEKQDTDLELVPIGDVYREAALARQENARKALVMPEFRLFAWTVAQKVSDATSTGRLPSITSAWLHTDATSARIRKAAREWLFSEQTKETWEAFIYFGFALPPFDRAMLAVVAAIAACRQLVCEAPE